MYTVLHQYVWGEFGEAWRDVEQSDTAHAELVVDDLVLVNRCLSDVVVCQIGMPTRGIPKIETPLVGAPLSDAEKAELCRS